MDTIKTLDQLIKDIDDLIDRLIDLYDDPARIEWESMYHDLY